jgi:transcription-repair coupling factor (superfamily II helicase)
VESIDRRQNFANIKFHPGSKIDPLRLMELVRNSAGAQFTPAGVLKWPLKPYTNPSELIDDLREMLLALNPELAPEPTKATKPAREQRRHLQ